MKEGAREIIEEAVGDRRHELAIETKTERGRIGLFDDRIRMLGRRIATL